MRDTILEILEELRPDVDFENETKLIDDKILESFDIVSLVFSAGLATSKSDARRAVDQGGVSVNGEKISAIDTVIARDMFNEGLVLKKGKKSFRKVIVK